MRAVMGCAVWRVFDPPHLILVVTPYQSKSRGPQTVTDTTATYHRSHALIIGVNDYAVASPLGYAVNDAEAVADVL